MAKVEEIAELTIALREKFRELDNLLDAQKRALPSYYKEEKTALARLIEKTIRVRQKMKQIDSLYNMSNRRLRNSVTLLVVLPQLFKLGNAPIGFAKIMKDMESYGIPSQDASNEIIFLWKKIDTLYPTLQKELQKAYTKRYAKTIDVKKANEALQGKVTVRVLFHSLESLTKGKKGPRILKSPKGLEVVQQFIENSKMDTNQYFEFVASTIFESIPLLLANFSEVFTRVYGPKLRLELIVYVYPFEKEGVVGYFIKRFRGEKGVVENIDIQGSMMRVWLSFQEIAKRLERRPVEQVAQNIASILSHELTHAFDKKYEKDGGLFDHIRMEGLAEFGAAIHQPTLLVAELQGLQHFRQFHSFREFVVKNKKHAGIAYILGIVMCLGIFFRRLKKRHHVIYTPYTPVHELVEVFKNPTYKKDLLETFRLINDMKTRTFFRMYHRAVKEGLAPDLFGDEIYNAIK